MVHWYKEESKFKAYPQAYKPKLHMHGTTWTGSMFHFRGRVVVLSSHLKHISEPARGQDERERDN